MTIPEKLCRQQIELIYKDIIDFSKWADFSDDQISDVMFITNVLQKNRFSMEAYRELKTIEKKWTEKHSPLPEVAASRLKAESVKKEYDKNIRAERHAKIVIMKEIRRIVDSYENILSHMSGGEKETTQKCLVEMEMQKDSKELPPDWENLYQRAIDKTVKFN